MAISNCLFSPTVASLPSNGNETRETCDKVYKAQVGLKHKAKALRLALERGQSVSLKYCSSVRDSFSSSG